jgi:hypothetical protein
LISVSGDDFLKSDLINDKKGFHKNSISDEKRNTSEAAGNRCL